MKGTMRRLQRGALFVLLAIQALGGGAVTLAHAAEPLTAPIHIEAPHELGCQVLHDVLRCALCHYASAQVVVQRAVVTPPARPTRPQGPTTRLIIAVSGIDHLTPPARAPPTLLS